MESNALIVKLLHGKDVRAFNFFQKLNVYARASLVSDDPSKKLGQDESQSQQQQRSPTVRECDGDPEWKHEMRFDLSGIPLEDCAHVLLRVDLFHEGVMFGDKHIGEVRVPLADLAEQGDGVVRFVSYQVKNPEGKPNGVLTFSYSVHGKGAAGTAPGPIVGGYTVVNPPPPHGGWVEAGAAGSENQPSSPEIKYPVIDFQSEPEKAYPAAVPYESYYPPPESYYPPPPEMLHPPPLPPPPPPPLPPPPPPPLPPPPPPPPPFAHGPCHYPPGPPPFGPWRHGPHGFGGGWRGAPWERDRGLSYWNGR